MKLSNLSQHGLMVVGYIATHFQEDNITAEAIAKEYNLQLYYVNITIKYLVKADLVRMRYGLNGGYVMSKPLQEITLSEVFKAMDGAAISHHYISEQAKHASFVLKMEQICHKAVAEENKILQATTLADLVG